ncbi:tetratricopeptide repeat protein [Aliikangiella maris]|uniref:Tetratricopeptide repeat protein n=2 Tax=Aliikangiella maris TaxID=3162458 RepID=A0ABV3MUQ8_9GAMM
MNRFCGIPFSRLQGYLIKVLFISVTGGVLLSACQNEEVPPEVSLYEECRTHFRATSYKVAAKTCEQAADLGVTGAQWLLAQIYDHGLNDEEPDPAKAFSWYLAAAKGGMVDAQTVVGESYISAIGVNTDYEQAFFWLSRAAKEDDANAEFALGNIFFEGTGKEKDISLALSWYKKAAAKKHVMSMNNLAWIYATSQHKAFRDLKKAQYWVRELEQVMDGEPAFLDTKAAVLALAGEFELAIELQNQAIANLPEDIDESTLIAFQQHLDAYNNQKAWVEEK